MTYKVYGVDFIQGFKLAMKDTFKKVLKDPTLFQDQTNLEKELAVALGEGIQTAGAVKKTG